jgi:hypothetical protein
MRISKLWYVLLVLMAGGAALVWARGPELQQDASADQLSPLQVSSFREVFPR